MGEEFVETRVCIPAMLLCSFVIWRLLFVYESQFIFLIKLTIPFKILRTVIKLMCAQFLENSRCKINVSCVSLASFSGFSSFLHKKIFPEHLLCTMYNSNFCEGYTKRQCVVLKNVQCKEHTDLGNGNWYEQSGWIYEVVGGRDNET